VVSRRKYSKPLQSREENGENCKEVQGMAGCRLTRVPVDQTPTGYRVPGFLRFEIMLSREGSTAQSETDGPRSMSDESTV